ncbi:MAG TPA: hypothetical protein DCX22_02490 [Dehalococcoidia bacterium]|nr:hypothetical protein [Dehalococcoidia bacterium]
MKFIHTGDWQLGMKASHVGAAASKVREARLLTAKRIGEIAGQHAADFILIAGDTFDDNGVDRALIQRAVDILSGYSVPVYIIPGNHDPLVPGSVWEHPAWRSARTVYVLKEKIPVDVSGGTLFPCPAYEKQSGGDPTAWIPAGNDGIRIGLAHGTVEGIRQDEPDYPIPRDAAQRAGLDYLAIGHWHSLALYTGFDAVTRMAYSGTHEPTKFGERDSGNILLVEIPSHGSSPVITPIHTGLLTWVQMNENIETWGDSDRLFQRVEGISNPNETLLLLSLSGLLFAQDREKIARIQEVISSRFLYAAMDISKLIPAPDDDDWVNTVPHGPIHDVALRLKELSDPAYAGSRPEGATVDVAARALLDLYGIIMETKR